MLRVQTFRNIDNLFSYHCHFLQYKLFSLLFYIIFYDYHYLIDNIVYCVLQIMIGILFFLFEFYDDQLLAFMVLILVWLCELFTLIRYLSQPPPVSTFPYDYIYMSLCVVYFFICMGISNTYMYRYCVLVFLCVLIFCHLAFASSVRTPISMKFFPRFFLLYFLVFHIYFFSYTYGMAS